jgi:hypothetical protein
VFKKLFVSHPESVGESYFQHMAVAFGFGFQMLGGALACIIHGIVPGLFEKSGSKTITSLHAKLLAKRACTMAPQPISIASRPETAIN